MRNAAHQFGDFLVPSPTIRASSSSFLKPSHYFRKELAEFWNFSLDTPRGQHPEQFPGGGDNECRNATSTPSILRGALTVSPPPPSRWQLSLSLAWGWGGALYNTSKSCPPGHPSTVTLAPLSQLSPRVTQLPSAPTSSAFCHCACGTQLSAGYYGGGWAWGCHQPDDNILLVSQCLVQSPPPPRSLETCII